MLDITTCSDLKSQKCQARAWHDCTSPLMFIIEYALYGPRSPLTASSESDQAISNDL